MMEFKLRALLEEKDFTATLHQNGTNSGKLSDDGGSKYKLGPSSYPTTPLNTALLNQNIWADSGGSGDEDFNLEYMDLDEFLSETGLVDTNFSNLLSNASAPDTSHNPLPEQPKQPSPQPETLQDLLSRTPDIPDIPASCGSLSPNSSSRECAISPEDVLPSFNPPQNSHPSPEKPKEESEKLIASSTAKDNIGIVKKRKYKEDGEGLSDTAVVIVPGKDGFNPAQAKFDPEELQPQPIIKKSKKQFVSDENKDEKYWRRRNKNNVAAKRSREARRAKENQIIMRAGFLETENSRLTEENERLVTQNQELRSLVEKLQSQLKKPELRC